MLLVSLPEMERGGEGLRTSSAWLMLREAASDTGVSDTGVSWRMDQCTQAQNKSSQYTKLKINMAACYIQKYVFSLMSLKFYLRTIKTLK